MAKPKAPRPPSRPVRGGIGTASTVRGGIGRASTNKRRVVGRPQRKR